MTHPVARLKEQFDIGSDRVRDMPSPKGVDRIVAVSMPEDRSFDRWEELDRAAAPLGYAAICVGSEESIADVADHVEIMDSFDFVAELERARSHDVKAWLDERERSIVEFSGDLPTGPWDDDAPKGGFWFPYKDEKHLDPWWLVLVPAQERWMALLALAYGSWNDCPEPRVHAALCRYWAETCGAHLVACSGDTLEFLVDRPPSTKTAALELAREHFLYCTDIVDQGCRTITALASRLFEGGVWSFWWD
ncbi:MAG: DUF4253 domain-containing protein [Polyangiaceae bacterium]